LKKYKLNKIYSPADLMMKQTEIRKIKINARWYLSETTKATNELIKIENTIPILQKGS
jgi:hypothetical protein